MWRVEGLRHIFMAGLCSWSARLPHKQEVAGSTPAPATYAGLAERLKAAVLKIAGRKPQGFKSSIRRWVNVAELVDSARLESGRPKGPQVRILPFTPNTSAGICRWAVEIRWQPGKTGAVGGWPSGLWRRFAKPLIA